MVNLAAENFKKEYENFLQLVTTIFKNRLGSYQNW